MRLGSHYAHPWQWSRNGPPTGHHIQLLHLPNFANASALAQGGKEQAIQTFKDHFLSLFKRVALTFPKDWWELCSHRPCCCSTSSICTPVSTPCNLHGNTSSGPTTSWMGTAGCCMLIHSTTMFQQSWNHCCHKGYSTCPTAHQYWCYNAFNKASDAIIVSKAIKLFHWCSKWNDCMPCRLSTALFKVPCTGQLTTNSPPLKCCQTFCTTSNFLSHLQGRVHLQVCTH